MIIKSYINFVNSYFEDYLRQINNKTENLGLNFQISDFLYITELQSELTTIVNITICNCMFENGKIENETHFNINKNSVLLNTNNTYRLDNNYYSDNIENTICEIDKILCEFSENLFDTLKKYHNTQKEYYNNYSKEQIINCNMEIENHFLLTKNNSEYITNIYLFNATF